MSAGKGEGRKCRIYLVCGSGGVGKTTVAAALGLKFAAAGRKTAVLTIDPAKRLATSLGLDALGDTPAKIAIGPVSAAGGELWAMMLDTKRTFDRIVERYAPTSEARDRILNNKIYQHLSSMLAGSQEYMAMERLYEIRRQDLYDAIVVDTPPVQNAVDFLDAPDRLSNMITNSMLHLLLKPSLALGKAGFRFLEKSSRQILKVFDRIIGFAFMQDISEMLVAFQDLLGGFEDRAREVRRLLAEPDTRFAAVCSPAGASLAETERFAVKLGEMGYRLERVVLNRVHPGPAFTRERIEKDKRSLDKLLSKEDAEALVENYREHLPLIKRDAKAAVRMTALAGKGALAAVPLFLSDVHDVKSLAEVAEHLQNFD